MKKTVQFLCLMVIVCKNEAARILAYYPSPSISHQVVFRPLTLELIKRGHELVVLTTDPMYPNGGGPPNLKEIDLHEKSYDIKNKFTLKVKTKCDRSNYDDAALVFADIIKNQIFTKDVQRLIKDKSESYDLIIVEAVIEGALGISHIFKAPVIQISSFGVNMASFLMNGASIHPFLYPSPINEKVFNLTVWDKLYEMYYAMKLVSMGLNLRETFDTILKQVFGHDVPSLEELRSNVDLLLLNIHHVWDNNRPVPPNVIYLGGRLHLTTQKELPKDLETYLNSSKNGVIYLSFGSTVDPSLISQEKIQVFINVFSKLPYDVLWKWNEDELPGRTKNIKISKWLPQTDLLKHPKVKLFITQGGLQSTDEAIAAGVPMIGLPFLADQKFNVEQYQHFGIGKLVDMETITEKQLSDAIITVLQDDTYRKNIEKLRLIINDQPQTPLELAVWWTEYVIRHKGAKHLRSPAANMSLSEYYEVNLLCLLLSPIFAVIVLIWFAYFICRRKSNKTKKD